MKITIPKPCHENWDLMTPAEKGRFCSVCTKVVRDFTDCSDEEIVSEISNSEEKICGNFRTTQLNRNLNFPFVNSLLTKFAVGFMLTSAGLEKVEAQKTCNVKTDTIKRTKLLGDVVLIDSSKMIKGKPSKVSGLNVSTSSFQGVIGKVAPQKNDKKPLIVLDGKIISEEKFNKINQKKIKKVEVIKDKKATELYGEKAKYGVILVSTKD